MLKNNTSAIVLGIMALALPNLAHAQAPMVQPQRPGAPAPSTPVKSPEPRGDNPAIGVPLPSLLQGNSAPAARTGGPSIPDSTQSFGIDNKRVDKTLDTMIQQADERVAKVKPEAPASMNPPDIAPYRSDLQQMSDIQRQLRLMELKQKQAEAAMKYWSTVYDPRKEEDVIKGAPVGKDDKTDNKPTVSGYPVGTAGNPAPPPMPAEAPKNDLPLPKVVSIMGGESSLKAMLLVPYVGEMQARVGTTLPGDRRVVKISSTGVNVSDPKLGVVTLGYGDSVALSPNATPSLSGSGAGVGGLGPNGLPLGVGTLGGSINTPTLLNIPRVTPPAPPVVTPQNPVMPSIPLPTLPKLPTKR